MNDQINATSALESAGGDPVKGTEPKVTNKTRSDWNDYINFLDKKGLKGSPTLDHNDLGGKMIDQYRKENPGTSISRDMVIPIQKDFSNYRDWSIKQIQAGKGGFAPGTNKDNFLKSLSVVDGLAGQRTTSFAYPSSYLHDMDTGETTREGFATADK